MTICNNLRQFMTFSVPSPSFWISQVCPLASFFSGVTPANQTKERPAHELSRGQTRTKVRCKSCFFPQGKNTRIHKMGESHEFFVLALSLVCFAGATPDFFPVLWSFLSILRPIPGVVLLDFPLFCRRFGCFWGLGTQIHHVSFSVYGLTLQPFFHQNCLR